MLRMFLTFTYLFSCRCRSDDVYVDFSLDLVCSRRYGTVRDFREFFEKSLYGRNLLLTIQKLSKLSLLPRDIRFSTNEGFVCMRMCRRFLKFAYAVVRVCMGKGTCFW